MTWTEAVGFATGALCVWLVVRQNIWNFPIGIVQCSFYLLVFMRVGLYADAGLQIIYIILGFLVWWWWLHGGIDKGPLHVRALRGREVAALGGVTVTVTACMTGLLATYTPSTVPFWDSITTVLSLIAQYMLTRKHLQNWWVWMTADVIYIGLYAYKGLWLTAILYGGFFALCIIGLREWRRSMSANPITAAASAVAPA